MLVLWQLEMATCYMLGEMEGAGPLHPCLAIAGPQAAIKRGTEIICES